MFISRSTVGPGAGPYGSVYLAGRELGSLFGDKTQQTIHEQNNLRVGGLKHASPTSIDSKGTMYSVQQEKEVLDLERYDHDDTALLVMPKLRAKSARSCLIDTVIGQSLDGLSTSKLSVKRLVLQRLRSLAMWQHHVQYQYEPKGYSPSHYGWGDRHMATNLCTNCQK